LATPTAVTVGLGKGAELGVLIKNSFRALQKGYAKDLSEHILGLRSQHSAHSSGCRHILPVYNRPLAHSPGDGSELNNSSLSIPDIKEVEA